MSQDNVRVGRESLTKKISFHDKHPKPYRTIDSLEKAPTRKKITIQAYPLKKDSQLVLPQSRRMKGQHQRRRSVMSSQGELATIESYIHRNIKYSLGRERSSNRQKYKRSEQVRSVQDAHPKAPRKQTDPNRRPSHFYSSLSVEEPSPVVYITFSDLNLQPLINNDESNEHQLTLQDVFEGACALYWQYVRQKNERVGQGERVGTQVIKGVKEELKVLLERSNAKLGLIMRETGEMSIKTLAMVGLVKHELGRHNEAIMYLNKAVEKTNNDLMLLVLPGQQAKPSQTLTMLSQSKTPRSYSLNIKAYLALSQSYKSTSNYLCAINTLLKCQQAYHKHIQPKTSQTGQYMTIQSRQEEGKKRSAHNLSVNSNYLQQDHTTNKFKKHSQARTDLHFNSSYQQLNQSQQQYNIPTHKRKESQRTFQEQTIKTVEYESVALNEGEEEGNGQMSAVWLLLARLYLKIKNYDKAIRYYRKCLQVTPLKLQPVIELASLYYTHVSPKRCLQWLNSSLLRFNKSPQLQIDYLQYHKALVLQQEGQLQDSYVLFSQIKAKQLWSQVSYYQGLIRMQQLNQKMLKAKERYGEVEGILMQFRQSIACFTSKEYLLKAYFQTLVVLVFEKKDYYGAQYEINRFRKMVPQGVARPPPTCSRIVRLLWQQQQQEESHGVSQQNASFAVLFDLVDSVISVLKMKISKGLNMLKQLSVRIQADNGQLHSHLGNGYMMQMQRVILQFKFYSYYIQRQYELSLKHINKLMEMIEMNVEREQGQGEHQVRMLGINKMMLECMILMRQGKFNYAISKLVQIQTLMNSQGQPTNTLILNNFYMVKALSYINLYTQLQSQKDSSNSLQPQQQTNKQILLSAEQLLRHCLITQKENSLIYYLISVIHYQVQEYESSLKYIRQALEYSDDHMIKHYFCKANTKTMLGRYQEAIKDYTNAIIVYKEQQKTEENVSKITKSPQPLDDYYQEQQIMYNQIYLNRAIAYLKEAYALSKDKHYGEHLNVIVGYRIKAGEDLLKYFEGLISSNIDLNADHTIRQRLLLFMHTDDPSHMFQIAQKLSPRFKPLQQEDHIHGYYLIKELNNCINALKTHTQHLTQQLHQQQNKNKKDSISNKHKKIQIIIPRKQITLVDPLQVQRHQFDLVCLTALKRSSNNRIQALQEALMSLLELTQEIYSSKGAQEQAQDCTLQQLFSDNCGQIFKWSDIFFFIGVIHFQLGQYETAIKYFEESYSQKKMNNSLYSLEKYLYPVLSKSRVQQDEEDDEQVFSQLEPLFENRIYCKEELQYNLGLCYLMLKKYKQAYFYLQNYPYFLTIIKKQIAIDSLFVNDNEFMHQSMDKARKSGKNEILIDQHNESNSSRSYKHFDLHQQSKDNLHRRSKKNIQSKASLDLKHQIQESQGNQSDGQQYMNITPFPTRNRLCSIYSPSKLDDRKFYLSFCLPKINLPLSGIFHPTEIELAKVHAQEDDNRQNSFSSQTQAQEDEPEEKNNPYQIDRHSFESVIDLEMKPIAPWIKQNNCGVIFTEHVVQDSIDFNSERLELKKEGKQGGRKGKNERYAQSSAKEQ